MLLTTFETFFIVRRARTAELDAEYRLPGISLFVIQSVAATTTSTSVGHFGPGLTDALA